MKFFIHVLSVFALILECKAATSIERVDVSLLDLTKGSCTVKINEGPPKSVDIDVESFVEGKDITLKFGAFSYIDGKYNEFIESDSVKICDMPSSDHPLVAFMYKEMMKAGNLASACPVKKGPYYLHGFSIEESDMPMALPLGSFKIELNGTLHEHEKDSPIFMSEIYFKEI